MHKGQIEGGRMLFWYGPKRMSLCLLYSACVCVCMCVCVCVCVCVCALYCMCRFVFTCIWVFMYSSLRLSYNTGTG